MPPVKKEQLYSEESFISYCHNDELGGNKFDIEITPMFLRAAEKDGLITPLHIEKQKRKHDGVEEEVDVRYYSPFQIFLVAGLIHNDVDENGNLRDPNNKEWQKQQGFRYINWGGMSSFSVDIYKKKRGEEPDTFGNHFSLADDFHQMLKLVHGLESENRYELMIDKQRLFTRLPNLAYNLNPILSGKSTYIGQYGLDENKIRRVIINVGYLATHIDPLERWFYYIQKHSQTRRDQLKGPAAVAQDLYGFCNIGYDILEVGFEKILPPLPDLIHPDIKPYMMERAGFASGSDIKAIRSARDKLKKWASDNAKVLSELSPTVEKGKLDTALARVESQINDYEKRYGDRRYVGSTRTIWPEKKLKPADLDEDTKKTVQSMVKQRSEGEGSDPKTLANLTAIEITRAIEWRLRDLQRAVSNIAYQIDEAIWPLHYKLEREKDMAKYPALEELGRKLKKEDPNYAQKYQEFWRTGVKEAERPVQEKIDQLDQTRNELRGIAAQTRLVFCAVCRSKPVMLHHGHNDAQVTSEAICDECLKSGKQLTTLKAGEWKCDQCGKMIYKFAHGNVLSDTLLNTSAVTIRLEYGRMEITARCPNRDCHAEQTRAIDEGWLP